MTDPAPPAVHCEGLERGFGRTRVLDGIDLRVGRGERIAVTGPNGAGKTTLLRVVAGLLRPERGRVRVLGGVPADPDVRRRTGYLAHRPFLYPRLTAVENARFWGRLHGARDAATRGADLLGRLGLDPGDPRPASAYSEGMRRRLGLACVLAPAPELVLCDEPFAGLDRDGVAAVTGLLAGSVETVIVATHEIERVPLTFDRIVALDRGRLVDPGEGRADRGGLSGTRRGADG